MQVPNPRRRRVGGVRNNQPEKLERAMSSGSRAVSLLRVRGNCGAEGGKRGADVGYRSRNDSPRMSAECLWMLVQEGQ